MHRTNEMPPFEMRTGEATGETGRIHTLHTRESYLVRSGLIEAFSFGPPLEVCGRNAAVFAYGRCATH